MSPIPPFQRDDPFNEDERLVRDMHALILGRAQTGIQAFAA